MTKLLQNGGVEITADGGRLLVRIPPPTEEERKKIMQELGTTK